MHWRYKGIARRTLFTRAPLPRVKLSTKCADIRLSRANIAFGYGQVWKRLWFEI